MTYVGDTLQLKYPRKLQLVVEKVVKKKKVRNKKVRNNWRLLSQFRKSI